MTSTTPNPAHVAAAPPAYQLPQRVTQARVLRSEWTKLRTQPSVFWALLATMIMIAGFGILYSLVRETRPPHGAAAIASFDPAGVSLLRHNPGAKIKTFGRFSCAERRQWLAGSER